MRTNQQGLLCLGLSILGVLAFSPALIGQVSRDSKAIGPAINDWSQQHLIFSKPANAEQAKRLEQDPRYWQQLRRLSPARLPGVVETTGALPSELRPGANASPARKGPKLNRDWSQDLGTGATVGATNYPAKYSLTTTTASCGSAAQPDFAVYGTGLTGSTGQADIVAFDNLYSGCGGTVPTIYWAYNTIGGTVTTSPLFSLDGTQVAFVQTDTAGDGVLVLLRWAASATATVGSPTTLTRLHNSEYPGCTTPCMTSIILKDASGADDADTNSSVFYDYADDIAYVGDDSGWLHKFTPVFNGVPAEVRSGGWPVQVNPGAPTALTSPVYDRTSGAVFVADNGGFLYQVSSGTPVVTTSGQLDFSSFADGGPGLIEGPVVDVTSELVYVFAPSDGSGGCPIGIGGADCTAVYQLAAGFLDGDTGTEAVVGSSTIEPAVPSPMYIGGFDSAYENSPNATGNLYVCGNTGGPPVLYQVPVSAGAFGTVNSGPLLSTDTTPCSPVTDVPNPNASGGATEWIFASVQTGGVTSGCAAGGCIFNFKDTPWTASTLTVPSTYALGQEVVDTHFQIQVVTKAGTAGTSPPSWQTMAGKTTDDGTVHWIDQGVPSAVPLASWLATHAYAKGNKILDTNGNIELVTSTGTRTSGGTMPTFNPTPGLTTTDGVGGLVWTNIGALSTVAMPQAGGTSGIVWDNTVGSGILAGASQIYFSTLGNGTCGGGCAVQASQSALQ
jgi:hypothetical protein